MDIQEIDLEFLSMYPNGFNDEMFLSDTKRYDNEKVRKIFQNELSETSLKTHILENRTSELVKPVINVVSRTWITSRFEKIAFRHFMNIPDTNIDFFVLLYEVMYGDLEMNFDAFVALLKTHIEVNTCSNAAKWPIISFFLVYSREQYYPVKPNTTKKIARALNFDIQYQAQPNLKTYHLINQMYDDFLSKSQVATNKFEADIELYLILK